MYDISIIIVSWNAKDFLFDCLQSIEEDGSSLTKEIIVVDNDSTDGSAEMVEKCYPEVRLIKNEHNYGFAKANNIGIAVSQGRYICLVNSDVKVFKECFNRLYDHIEQNPSIGVIAPRMLNGDLSLQYTCRRFPSIWNLFCSAMALNRIFPNTPFFSSDQMFYFKHDVVRQIEVIAGCFLMVRRQACEQVGLLDDQFFMYAEDMDWCKRFWTAGWQIVYFPMAESIHYGGGSSKNEPIRFSVAQEKSLFQYWRKHHGRLSCAGLYAISILQHLMRITAETLKCAIRPQSRIAGKEKIKKHIKCIGALKSH